MRTPNSQHKADLRDYLAAERTFLAWIRTGLALMGFGFVVARFGLSCNNFNLFGSLCRRRRPGPHYGSALRSSP
jgi:uncharacterized membrane protein YidH (DUF202 family)